MCRCSRLRPPTRHPSRASRARSGEGSWAESAGHVHRLLQALLDLPTPEYRHHPLLLGPDGTRLAKRHGAPSLEAMRLAGEDGRAFADRLRQGLLPVGFASAKA